MDLASVWVYFERFNRESLHGLVFICLVLVLYFAWLCLYEEWPCMVPIVVLPKVDNGIVFALPLHDLV